jgi:hypothetical protein
MTLQRSFTTQATAAGTSQEPETEGPSSLDTITMAIFHEATIHLLLNIERFALEAIGHESDLDFEHDMNAPLTSSNRSSTSDQELCRVSRASKEDDYSGIWKTAQIDYRPACPPTPRCARLPHCSSQRTKGYSIAALLPSLLLPPSFCLGTICFHLVAFDEDKAFRKLASHGTWNGSSCPLAYPYLFVRHSIELSAIKMVG